MSSYVKSVVIANELVFTYIIGELFFAIGKPKEQYILTIVINHNKYKDLFLIIKYLYAMIVTYYSTYTCIKKRLNVTE